MNNASFVLPAGRLPITDGPAWAKIDYLVKNREVGNFTFKVSIENAERKIGKVLSVKILVVFLDKGMSTGGENWFKGNLAILNEDGVTLENRAFMYCPEKREGYIDEQGGKYGYVPSRWGTDKFPWEI